VACGGTACKKLQSFADRYIGDCIFFFVTLFLRYITFLSRYQMVHCRSVLQQLSVLYIGYSNFSEHLTEQPICFYWRMLSCCIHKLVSPVSAGALLWWTHTRFQSADPFFPQVQHPEIWFPHWSIDPLIVYPPHLMYYTCHLVCMILCKVYIIRCTIRLYLNGLYPTAVILVSL
jgi:hypothetical protein